MIYGYERVSSKGQGLYGTSLESQKNELIKAGASEENIYSDVFTGVTADRPRLNELIEVVKEGDMVIVTKLDRLARNTTEGIAIIDRIVDKGASLNILNMGIFNDTPTGRLTRTIFLAFAEYEHDMILERMNEGKRIAKVMNPDFKVGRKSLHIENIDEYYEMFKSGQKTVSECCEELGISRSSWYKLIKGITAA